MFTWSGSPKGAEPKLVGDVKLRLAQILHEVGEEQGWMIKAIEIAPEHVHPQMDAD